MLDALVQLTSFVPPPEDVRTEFDWIGVEQKLKLPLPIDYKRLVETYGPGSFDDFIWILLPMTSNQNLDLVRQKSARLDALRAVRTGGEVVPFQVDPDHETLIPWAITDNGDVCYWVVDRNNFPEQWTVAVNEARGQRWHEYSGSATAWLLAILSKSLHVDFFPDDFPSNQPIFRPPAK